MSIYGVTLGSDGWYVVLQDVPRIGPLDWSGALEVAEGLNQEIEILIRSVKKARSRANDQEFDVKSNKINAASPNDAQARQKTGPCEPGTGLEAAEVSECGASAPS